MGEEKILDGIRIVDFSWIFTGPLVTKFMGDYGAEVIKIESPARPDDVRAIGPYRNDLPGVNRSCLFALYNSSKYGMTLNLRKPESVEIAKKLIAKSDIVVESYRAGVIEKLGLGYETLRRIKPDIIMLSCTIYGQTGPASVQAMLGTFFQSEASITHFIGWPDRAPVVVPNPYTDYHAPWMGLSAVLSALDYRRRTGRGQHIDLTQIESTPHFLGPVMMDFIVNRREQSRSGNRSSHAAPHGVFRCRGDDRWCAVAVHTDEEWSGFCKALGRPDWAEDKKFSTLTGRKQNEDELETLIAQYTVHRAAEEIVEALRNEGVAASIVQNGQDLMEKDAQLRYRGAFLEKDHPEMGKCTLQQPPYRFSESAPDLKRPPCLGEHTETICTQLLGLSDEEFVRLSADGVFG
jgi:benzylsuccinate CoA-transferase BbsF subunit